MTIKYPHNGTLNPPLSYDLLINHSFLRYLSCKPDITRDKLQLIGITSLHIAAKLEVCT